MHKLSYLKQVLLLLVVLFLLFFTSTVYAKSNGDGSISGKIVDKNSQPVEYANVALYDNDSSFITGSTSNPEGIFLIENL